jgi:hypothetical protein
VAVERRSVEAMQKRLDAEGFNDLDSWQNVIFFQVVASTLEHRRLETFEDLNDRVGTTIGIASSLVRKFRDELNQRGYLRVSRGGGIELTDKGIRAAHAIGIDLDRT